MEHFESENCKNILIACERGCIDCLRLFIKNKETINQKDQVGRTPLHYASCFCKPECTKILLENGANVQEKTIYGRTPLHTASAYGSTECVKILLESEEIILNEKDEDGWTPLHHAARFNNIGCVNLLLNKGHDLSIKENKGKTPFDVTRTDEIRNTIFENLLFFSNAKEVLQNIVTEELLQKKL